MKKILLAACGKTPQIITETVYALWEKGQLPDRIRIVTTKAGKEALHNDLLHPEHGIFYKFCAEYGIDAHTIDFSWQNILVPRGAHGLELEDITSEEDSIAFLKTCLEESFALTNNLDDTVYFSIAAGRKTMGASLTLAAQYYGRRQDRLYHVLVHSDYEYSPFFFYPPKIPQTIQLHNSKGEIYYKSTEYAKISLVNIPFFSIREQLSSQKLAKPVLPEELLLGVETTAAPQLIVDVRNLSIQWQGKKLQFQVAWFTLYLFFITKRKRCAAQAKNDVEDTIDIVEITQNNQEIASLYHKLSKYIPCKDIPQSDSGILALNAENFRSYRSKVNAKIKKSFGSVNCESIGISTFGKKPDSRYGIVLEPHLIEIIDEAGGIWE